MKISFKKIATAVLSVVTVFSMTAFPTLATPVDQDGNATVPVFLTQTATGIDVTVGTGIDPLPTDENDPNYDSEHEGEIPINFDDDDDIEVYGADSEAVYMYAEANSNDASATNLVITNNSAAAPVYVKGIAISNITNGYSLENYDSDFNSFQADSGAFGLKLTSGTAALEDTNHDLVTAYTSNGDPIAASGTNTYGLDGKTAISTSDIELAKVADCVVTFAMKPTTNNSTGG